MTDPRSNTLQLRRDAGEEVAESFLGGRKGELLKLIVVVAFSALASYFATVIRIAVLETDVQWIKQAVTDIKADIRNVHTGGKP